MFEISLLVSSFLVLSSDASLQILLLLVASAYRFPFACVCLLTAIPFFLAASYLIISQSRASSNRVSLVCLALSFLSIFMLESLVHFSITFLGLFGALSFCSGRFSIFHLGPIRFSFFTSFRFFPSFLCRFLTTFFFFSFIIWFFSVFLFIYLPSRSSFVLFFALMVPSTVFQLCLHSSCVLCSWLV